MRELMAEWPVLPHSREWEPDGFNCRILNINRSRLRLSGYYILLRWQCIGMEAHVVRVVLGSSV